MSASDSPQTSSDFAEAYDYLQRHDQTKDEFVRLMITKISTLEERVREQDIELKHKKDLASYYHKNLKQLESELQSLKVKQEKSNFTLVLLDGDIMLFHDKYLEKGMDGGKEAARGLKIAVEEYMDEKGISSRILVQIYANVSGLKKVYSSCDVNGFIQGFNMFDGLYQIVDAGNGKECSDEKVKKLFELFIRDIHCNHIIFGVSADNGYARLLEAYAGNERLTLLEGPPFASELASIVKQSQTTQFTTIFRSTKKETPVHPSSGSPLDKSFAQLSVSSPTPAHTTPFTNLINGSYAALASRPAAKSIPQPTTNDIKNTKLLYSEDGYPIHHNARGERVDEKLPKVTNKDLEAVKSKKLCNNYHLFNNCSKDSEDCEHTHGRRLNETEQLAQRVLARSTPCFIGPDCTNAWCTYGHQCFYGSSCNRPQCKFPHVADTKIVRTIEIK